jgi:hypothetical protein
MIQNATLTRIDSPLPADAGGTVSYAFGGPMSCRCAVNPLSSRDRSRDQANESEGSFTLSVLVGDLARALARAGYPITTLAVEQRLTVKVDRQAAATYRVRELEARAGGSLESLKAFVEKD